MAIWWVIGAVAATAGASYVGAKAAQRAVRRARDDHKPVSYTHLTLPTILLV